MNRFKIAVAAFVSTLALSLGLVASAATAWHLDISTPNSVQTSHTFNVQYTVLATDNANFTVQLLQNEVPVGSPQNTNTDPNGLNGNSGTFAVNVPSDGSYKYQVQATCSCGGASQTTAPKTVNVDATAPAAPTYNGKTRSGNAYTISFKAPADADVQTVKIFASTSSSFTANSATQIGTVNVSPSQVVSFGYNAPDGTPRFVAVQAFDGAGNGSNAVGDPNIVVVTQATSTTTGSGVNGGGSGAGGATNGTVEGATTGGTNGSATNGQGQVNSNGSSSSQAGVLGTETGKKAAQKNHFPWGPSIIAVLAVGSAAYYWFIHRAGRGFFIRGE